MDESLQAQIDAYLRRLDWLILRGRKLRDNVAADPAGPSALAAYRGWQQDCGVAINELSGGSKGHWLARAFSEAFLVRSPSGEVIEAVAPADIIARVIGVLEQAVSSLAQMSAGQSVPGAAEAVPVPRRFEFVGNAELRPVLERAYSEARVALEQGRYDTALVTCCGILESIVTDALERKGLSSLASDGAPEGKIADWPFETRLAVAESAGIIRGGWARLPEVARQYRELAGSDGNIQAGVSERDARRTLQVLNVVMRDLNPGR